MYRDEGRYNKELSRMIFKGIPQSIAKKAAHSAATPVKTLPELLSKLGDVWMAEHGNRGYQPKQKH